MSVPAEKRPIFDDRVNEILRGLTEGKTRDDLAKEFGLANYKSLDMYMRRKNFTWDPHKKNYVPAHSRVKEHEMSLSTVTSSKVAQVIALFKREGADPLTIAKRLGFSDHRELARYMKTKGYEWSSEANNYVKTRGEIREEADGGHDLAPDDIMKQASTSTSTETSTTTSTMERQGLEKYLPLLEMLERNKERLIDLLVPAGSPGKIPRYIVPGVPKTKTVHMMNTLEQLVVDFSREKNISQREIFEVALIEFFRRYGYEREVEQLLGQ